VARLRLGVAISRRLGLRAAHYWLSAGRRSAPRDRAMAGLLLFVDSLLNRCYLIVSGSVRVRRGVVGRLGWVHHTIPTDSVPTDAIPTVHAQSGRRVADCS